MVICFIKMIKYEKESEIQGIYQEIFSKSLIL